MREYMRAAIEEAEKGLNEGGIPIGSVLVYQGKIIGRGHNRRVQKGSTVLHGEMDALTDHLLDCYGRWRDGIRAAPWEDDERIRVYDRRVLTQRLGDYSQARAWLQQSLALWRTLDDPSGTARALNNLAGVALEVGNYAEAAKAFDEGVAILTQDAQMDDRFQAGMSLSIRTTLIPASTAFWSSVWRFGLVGVIAMPFTPCEIIDSIAAISPSSSVPLLPWA